MEGIQSIERLMNKLENSYYEKIDEEGNKIKVSFKFNTKASINDIQLIEEEMGLKLPNPFKEFLLKFNGAKLFDYDGLDGFMIYGTENIAKANEYAKATFDDDWNEDLIIFAKYIGESNYLAFKRTEKDEYNIIDCFFEEMPSEWRTIESSFDKFIYSLIKNDGRKYWLT